MWHDTGEPIAWWLPQPPVAHNASRTMPALTARLFSQSVEAVFELCRSGDGQPGQIRPIWRYRDEAEIFRFNQPPVGGHRLHPHSHDVYRLLILLNAQA